MNKIGILIDNFGVSVKKGIELASQMGAGGIQFFTVSGDMAPENLSAKDRRELLKNIKDKGLTVTALCGDLGGLGFAVAHENADRVEKSKRILELAKELETDIVTTHIANIPIDVNHDRYKILQEACEMLGTCAESLDGSFALETGPEKAETMKKFLDNLGTKNIKVNYDPANLAMVAGDDPVQGVYTLKDYIVHTHVKDGIRKKDWSPEKVFDLLVSGNLKDFNIGECFEEKLLGEGSVNFPKYFEALKSIGYDGFYTIERESDKDPIGDIEKEVKLLKKFLY